MIMNCKQVPVEVFSRVVGYYRPVSQWHKGKQAEFADRFCFDVKSVDIKSKV